MLVLNDEMLQELKVQYIPLGLDLEKLSPNGDFDFKPWFFRPCPMMVLDNYPVLPEEDMDDDSKEFLDFTDFNPEKETEETFRDMQPDATEVAHGEPLDLLCLKADPDDDILTVGFQSDSVAN
ncbi:hypothetical protein VTN00DRAFT_9461 [Thermoascus crustaceus]|uniref:uncharacterized protein n=1 Tax=Thermoascus crustaceus TaxID=5088 RepID=UPI00374421C0